ncbi:MAG TPA: NUDIX domain-containing protein [Candidatus Saccharimonadales bacterium]
MVVDSDDVVIGASPLAKAWAEGLAHRIVYVVVEDSQGRVLLHRRAPGMVLDPNRWDTVGGHVDISPDYEESARLELLEEAGIEAGDLQEVAHFYSETPYNNGTHPKRFIKIFWLRYDGEPDVQGDDEVSASRWFTKQEIASLKDSHPEQIAIGLEICLPYILKEYEDHEHQAAGQTNRPLFHLR